MKVKTMSLKIKKPMLLKLVLMQCGGKVKKR